MNQFKNDPVQELREAIQFEKDELRKQVRKSWTVLLVFAVFVLLVALSAILWAWWPREGISSFHATHFEKAILSDYNGKKAVYLINGADTLRLEVR